MGASILLSTAGPWGWGGGRNGVEPWILFPVELDSVDGCDPIPLSPRSFTLPSGESEPWVITGALMPGIMVSVGLAFVVPAALPQQYQVSPGPRDPQ